MTHHMRKMLLAVAALALSSACSCSKGGSTQPNTAATITKVSGDGQSARFGTVLASPLVFQTNDQHGNAFAGATVNCNASGGATISASSIKSDASGRGSLTLTTSAAPGANGASCTLAGSTASVAFSATSKAAVPTTFVKLAGDNQTANTGTALATQLQVKLTDELQLPIAGASVSFAVAAGGGSLSPASATTDANGVAKASWTLGSAAGAQSVTATTNGLAAVTFSATAIAVPVSRTLTNLCLPVGQFAPIGVCGDVTVTTTTTANTHVVVDFRGRQGSSGQSDANTAAAVQSIFFSSRAGAALGVVTNASNSTSGAVNIQPANGMTVATGWVVTVNNGTISIGGYGNFGANNAGAVGCNVSNNLVTQFSQANASKPYVLVQSCDPALPGVVRVAFDASGQFSANDVSVQFRFVHPPANASGAGTCTAPTATPAG